MNTIDHHSWYRAACASVVVTFILLMGSCSHVQPSQPKSRAQIDEELVKQIEAKPGKANKLKIVVGVANQTGKLLDGDQTVASFPLSSGKQGHSTPYGNFSVYNKEKENTSSLYGSIYDSSGKMTVPYADSRKNKVPKGGRFEGAAMPYTMHFSGYCALHEGFVPDPPQRVSHGCVRLTPDVAELLFRLCPVGTPVVVMH